MSSRWKYVRYREPKKVYYLDFDFRDVQTKPAKWNTRTPPQNYAQTPMRIYELDQKRKKRHEK